MKSSLEIQKTENTEKTVQKIRNIHRCPECNKNISISIDSKLLRKIKQEHRFPYAHLHLHGNPLHAMLCYVDSDLRVRSIKIIKSINIDSDM